ncbi:urease accessory protein E [Oleiphilus messinensis]|uniref:Urease accessory protein UreE n=1 Tax=Oleiphilus messinensis TaxID=141451 RepID=A0A1Y0I4P2_9GAMM|nr:urease accessory protein UreE [Oleiphilus messinensis]ARU54756.1 urease accessory protein E [Oleiphilus messinensis]
MLKLVKNKGHIHAPYYGVVTLSYDERVKGRLKSALESGEEVGLFLERGKVLQDGDVLESECGRLVLVKSLPEQVVIVRTNDWFTFSRCCYHLGNRHVPLEIGALWLRMKSDHVLEDMVRLLGLDIESEVAPFNPESGAYSGSSHAHKHGHSHG